MNISSEHSSTKLSAVVRRRKEILAAATSVLVNEPGASMATVAQAAGISRTTLHTHFAKRDQMLRAVAERALDTCESVGREAEASAEEADGGLRRCVELLITIAPQLSFLWRSPSFDHDVELGLRWLDFEQRLGVVVKRAKTRGAVRGNRPLWWDLGTLLALVYVASESIYAGRLAPLDAPDFVVSTLGVEGGSS
ncbi:MAG: TetR/AcrR family transcriptional regulator [Acidimicrobiales bacterium]